MVQPEAFWLSGMESAKRMKESKITVGRYLLQLITEIVALTRANQGTLKARLRKLV